MKIEDTKGAGQHGLFLSKLTQVARSVTFERGVKLNDTGCLGDERIGLFSYLGNDSEIKNADIGRFCSIARNVAIGAPEHPVDWVSSHPIQYNGLRWFDTVATWNEFSDESEVFRGNRKRTRIGHDVWICRNVVIRQGVTVGTGAVIGANAFVNRDVPPYAMVGGVPGKVIRYRFDDETVARLLASEWWTLDLPEELRRLYSKPLAFLDLLEEKKAKGLLKPLTIDTMILRRSGKDYELTPS